MHIGHAHQNKFEAAPYKKGSRVNMKRTMWTMRNHVKMHKPRLLLGTVAALGMAVGLQGISRAQITVSKYPTVTKMGGGIYKWDYSATLAPGFTLSYGDFFNIIDFDG